MFDLLVKNATLCDGREGMDVACKGGLIVGVERNIEGDSRRVIEANNFLVCPPFVDAHFHMDATLSLGVPRMNVSGTLLEGIGLWGELREQQSVEEIVSRALRYCDLAVSMGIGAIRSHVDICDDDLKGVEAILEVRDRVKGYIDLQCVGFPQDGFIRSPRARENLVRGLDMGLDVVGGIPHFERTMEEGRDSVRALCELASDRGLLVDMHCDESDDPMSRHIETLSSETVRLGLQGRVTGSHLTSMHSMDNYYVSKLIPLIYESGVMVVSNPLISVMLQGRHDIYPIRRGLTRVRELRDAGIEVGFGSDCVMDPWYSLGRGDMLDVAFMGLHVCQLSSWEDMSWSFDAVTENSARIMCLEGYGVEKGKRANFNILQSRSKVDAVRLRTHCLFVIRGGDIISENVSLCSRLYLDGRPSSLDPSDYYLKV